MVRVLKILGVIVGLFAVSVFGVNVLQPLVYREVDQETKQKIENTSYRSDDISNERICCIDTNEEALLWRLRMIAAAQESIVMTTFDMRTDQSGTDVMAALYHAAERGVQVKVLLDGIYQHIFLKDDESFEAFCSHENIEVRFYNPVSLPNIYKVNYRMHDKYLIIDDQMYLLGGRNTNDIFLGNYKKGINVDREILVYESESGQGESFQALIEYFNRIWNESCVKAIETSINEEVRDRVYKVFDERYTVLAKNYPDMETYNEWEMDTYPADKITLVSNGISADKKQPEILYCINYLASYATDVLIQTPYVICNDVMYDMLCDISKDANVEIMLNAVEKGSNPWGCTDYLNNKDKLLETGIDIYELMNESAVHTKTIVIDDDISIVGSYNLDMRSTYLDTELMLIIDSEQLNSHIREMADEYKLKSVAVFSDGTEVQGPLFEVKELSKKKEMFYGVLKIVIRPFRHLL